MERLDESFSSLIDYTSRNMRRFATDRLQRLGLTVDQWAVLKLMEEAGGVMQFAEMSQRLLRDKPTLTRIIDILVRDALVSREEDPLDRRKLRIRLTKTGHTKVRKASIVVAQLRDEGSRGITKRDLDALRRILGKLNHNMDEGRQRGAPSA